MAQVSTRATVRVTIIKFDRTLQLIVIKYMLVNLNIDCRMSLQSNLILNVKNYFGLFVTTGTMYVYYISHMLEAKGQALVRDAQVPVIQLSI